MNPTGHALVQQDRRTTYSELEELISKFAAELEAIGVRKGDRVALLLENCPEYIVTLLAAAKIGAITVPLNIRETSAELAFILRDCGAKIIICSSTVLSQLPVRDEIKCVKSVRVIDLSLADPFEALPRTEKKEAATVTADDVAVILYTSGTTGEPKGAKLSHVNIAHSILHYVYGMELSSDDRSIVAVPLSHVTGLVALALPILMVGGTLIIMQEFRAENFIRLAASERMTHSVLVPAMFALCLLNSDIGNYDLRAWRVSGYGGAIMPESTLQRIDKVLPQLKLINCYGATETASPAIMMPPVYASERAHQVGLPLPCADIVIMDEDAREVPTGEAGEIWISGPMVVSGYWNNSDATTRAFAGSYWKSGDIGIIDADGFVQIIDRIKDVINRGGYKIFASQVENEVLAHPSVKEVAVVAKDCPVLGERVHAFVVGEPTLNSDDLQAHCTDRLADFKRPEEYHFVASLPRNANGKVLKRKLRSMLETL
ncbi:class I adenylate-forming enzyme family protein [Parafrankia sp. BMG5.11]|uniref:class I adenylate-forming enzyme family protein n=1 Tax=Parafrankia sp. BMG5.11 TaxID=222540 RepID=UPI00140433F2|nr:AMP-binding protein [Parafrankia sp. BMG5.11]